MNTLRSTDQKKCSPHGALAGQIQAHVNEHTAAALCLRLQNVTIAIAFFQSSYFHLL